MIKFDTKQNKTLNKAENDLFLGPDEAAACSVRNKTDQNKSVTLILMQGGEISDIIQHISSCADMIKKNLLSRRHCCHGNVLMNSVFIKTAACCSLSLSLRSHCSVQHFGFQEHI